MWSFASLDAIAIKEHMALYSCDHNLSYWAFPKCTASRDYITNALSIAYNSPTLSFYGLKVFIVN